MATILKNKFEGNFVIVPKAFLTDESLKLRERGLIATILLLRPSQLDLQLT